MALATLAVALVAGSACSPRRETLTVGIVDLPATGLVHVARHYGFFRTAALDVRFVSFSTGRDALEALLAGRVDVATTFETPLAARAVAGDRPRILTTLHQSSRNTRVVVPVKSGIRGPEDLRGRRVAVAPGTNAEYFLDTLVTLAGLEALEVWNVNAVPAEAAELLARGEVDAVAVWYPWAVCGHPPLEDVECLEIFSDSYTELTLLATSDPVLARRREALRRFLSALSRAEALVVESPDAAVAALTSELPNGGGPHLAETWRRVTPQLGLDHLMLSVLEREGDWIAARMDEPPAPVDFRALVRPELLLEIDPSAVTLLGSL